MDSSTLFTLLFFLLVATWTERVACCVDFDSDCALVDEIRNSAHVIIFPGTKLYEKSCIQNIQIYFSQAWQTTFAIAVSRITAPWLATIATLMVEQGQQLLL